MSHRPQSLEWATPNMRIYNGEQVVPGTFGASKTEGKKYKSLDSQPQRFIRAKALSGKSRKKSRKKQISEKNIKFLEGIGLKVKQ